MMNLPTYNFCIVIGFAVLKNMLKVLMAMGGADINK